MFSAIPAMAVGLSGATEVEERGLEVADYVAKVGQRVVVGEQPKTKPPAVTHCSDAKRGVLR